MFGSFKKAMVIVAIAGVGAAAAPAMASAGPTWNTTATATPGQAASGAGTLTLTMPSGASTTCDVAVTADLWNANDAGTVRGLGEVTSFLLGAPAGGTCSTNVPGCTVTATANTTTPWPITVTNDGTVDISGISFQNVYAGATCALNGVTLPATGSLGGSISSPGVLSFVNAAGLTTPLGDPVVNGDVEMTWEDDGSPVELS